jgi:DNA-binding NarL/FixJ family response regulator
VLTDEPLRLEGLTSIFEDRPGEGYAPLSPTFGKIDDLLADSTLLYLFVDLNSSSGRIEAVEAIRRRRPDMRLIIIGPEADDRLIMDLILTGARAYLDLKASPRIVRQAVEVVTSGSIWAPRRLLSQLVDRLLGLADTSLTNAPPHLTERERQVLELILLARSNREIAKQLGIEEHTVHAHVGRLLRKTGADNRVDLSMRALSSSLFKDESGGIDDRRRGDRRRSDRRQGPESDPRVFTDK